MADAIGTCSSCGARYPEGHTHVCAAPRPFSRSGRAAGAGCVGAIAGAFAGFVLTLLVAGLLSGGSGQAGLAAMFFGAPIGALVVGLVAWWRALRSQPR